MRISMQYHCPECDVYQTADLVPMCWNGCGLPMVAAGSKRHPTQVPSDLDDYLAPFVPHGFYPFP